MHSTEPGFRFAAIADVHGNLPALEAVVADLAGRNVQAVVNLGDHLSGPLEPGATADRLMSLPFIHIRGNQDRVLLEPPGATDGLAIAATRNLLAPRHLDWLRTLPETLLWREEVLLCHGTPRRDDEYLLEEVTEWGVRPASEVLVLERLGGARASLILCGHSHVQRTVRISGDTLVVNPGSVGLPAYTDELPCPHGMESGSPHACYAVLERQAQGWRVERIRVPYDHERAARQAIEGGRTDWAGWLRTGRTEPASA